MSGGIEILLLRLAKGGSFERGQGRVLCRMRGEWGYGMRDCDDSFNHLGLPVVVLWLCLLGIVVGCKVETGGFVVAGTTTSRPLKVDLQC